MVMPFRELYGANEIVIRFIPFSDAYWKKNWGELVIARGFFT